MYCIGDKIKISEPSEFSEVYLLVQVESYKVCLVGLESCNRWSNPVLVDDVMNISQSEFDNIMNLTEDMYDYNYYVLEKSKMRQVKDEVYV